MPNAVRELLNACLRREAADRPVGASDCAKELQGRSRNGESTALAKRGAPLPGIAERVEDGWSKPQTTLHEAETLAAEQAFERKRRNLLESNEGVAEVTAEAHAVFQELERSITEIGEKVPDLNIRCETTESEFVAIGSPGSIHILLSTPTVNRVGDVKLRVWEYHDQLLLPSERATHRYLDQPKRRREKVFVPDFTSEIGWGWRQEEAANVLSRTAFVKYIGSRFIALGRERSRR